MNKYEKGTFYIWCVVACMIVAIVAGGVIIMVGYQAGVYLFLLVPIGFVVLYILSETLPVETVASRED